MLRRTLTELSDSEYRYASALSWSSPVPPCRNVVKSSISVVAKQENVLNLGFELLGCLPHQMSNQAVNSVLVSAQIIREGVAPRLGTSRETFRDCSRSFEDQIRSITTLYRGTNRKDVTKVSKSTTFASWITFAILLPFPNDEQGVLPSFEVCPREK
jgi:hypothetical protein